MFETLFSWKHEGLNNYGGDVNKKFHFSVPKSGHFVCFFFFVKIKDSRHFQLAIYSVFHAESESAVRMTNSFTLRRKLRKIDLRESRFLIVRFLIICLHRNTSLPRAVKFKTQLITWEHIKTRSHDLAERLLFSSLESINTMKPMLTARQTISCSKVKAMLPSEIQ